jgi:hypothetical protein
VTQSAVDRAGADAFGGAYEEAPAGGGDGGAAAASPSAASASHCKGVMGATRQGGGDADAARPFSFLYRCIYPGCGKLYRSTDAARKHARTQHKKWLRDAPRGPSGFCELIQASASTADAALAKASSTSPTSGPPSPSTPMDLDPRSGGAAILPRGSDVEEPANKVRRTGEVSSVVDSSQTMRGGDEGAAGGEAAPSEEAASGASERDFFEAVRQWAALSEASLGGDAAPQPTIAA